MRPILALGAATLTALAALVSFLDGRTMELGFFAVLTLAAAGAALGLAIGSDTARLLAKAITALVLSAAVWIGALLVMYQSACACSGPIPTPEATYLGLTATAYHLVGMYGATALLLIASFGRSAFLDRPVGRIERPG